MARRSPHIPFERYADDIVCHCRTEAEARALWHALGERLADCKLELHPEKTKIVYCKDVNRPSNFPVIAFDFLGFQFRARKTMWRKGGKRVFTHSFQPAVSPKALKRSAGRSGAGRLHRRSDKSLDDLAADVQSAHPWLDHLLQPLLSDAVASDPEAGSTPMSFGGRVANSSGCVHQTKGRKGLVRPAPPRNAEALRSLAAMSWQRPNIGSRMNREVHVRFWERPGVKFPGPTQHPDS